MMCFFTDSNLKALSSSNTIFVGDTFSSCPMFFLSTFYNPCKYKLALSSVRFLKIFKELLNYFVDILLLLLL